MSDDSFLIIIKTANSSRQSQPQKTETNPPNITLISLYSTCYSNIALQLEIHTLTNLSFPIIQYTQTPHDLQGLLPTNATSTEKSESSRAHLTIHVKSQTSNPYTSTTQTPPTITPKTLPNSTHSTIKTKKLTKTSPKTNKNLPKNSPKLIRNSQKTQRKLEKKHPKTMQTRDQHRNGA